MDVVNGLHVNLDIWVNNSCRTEIRVYDEEYPSLMFQTGSIK